ncbi:hypothetical protein [Paraburkholderia phenoliruptrix]|uniref:hypothetical protein n=1 Tax=Paraburkholderia phenoliruptrix TaxID=252970 RepID=UPI002869AACA|nr:hypothetical protein [Paraburkholderia phenoliruptrix]WMY11097.1 hypothetical protein P3F88_31055 [Paraburkholderia phenoliruptrix]
MKKTLHDPRTVARSVPGLFEVVFPQLTTGVVVHLNQSRTLLSTLPLSHALVESSSLQNAMLFELGMACAESRLITGSLNWEEAKASALNRQRRYFDAEIPAEIEPQDQLVAEKIAQNVLSTLSEVAHGKTVEIGPAIPGLGWVSPGHGDFAFEQTLIETKCTHKNFSMADYRQVLLYWLLSYAAAIEGRGKEWSGCILLNPRNSTCVTFSYDALLPVVAAGQTKLDVLQAFRALVDSSDQLQ